MGAPDQPLRTHWSRIRALGADLASEAGTEAWEHLHATYRPAMVRFVRGLLARARVCSPDEAEDVVQAFLLASVEKGWLTRADPRFGRFRVFVRVLLARFTRDHLAHLTAQKRRPAGGPPVPLDPLVELVGGRGAAEMNAVFRADWAACLARAAIARVRARSPRNAVLLDALLGAPGADREALAMRVGVKPAHLPVAVSRARHMFAEALWDALKQSVTHPEDREAERRLLEPYLARYLDPDRAPSFFGGDAAPPPDRAGEP